MFHLLLWLMYPIPWLKMLFCLSCQLYYLFILKGYPYIPFVSPRFIGLFGKVYREKEREREKERKRERKKRFLLFIKGLAYLISWYVVLTLMNHFNWFHYFVQEASFSTCEILIFYGTGIWFSPLALLVCLSASDITLPNYHDIRTKQWLWCAMAGLAG